MTPVPVAFEITPLTHKGKDQKVYQRRKEVTDQLEGLRESSEESLVARIKIEREDSPGSIKSESLVFLYKIHSQSEIGAAIWDTLFLRIRSLIGKLGRNYSIPQWEYEDYVQEVNFRVIEKISSDSDEGDYAQVSFGPFVLGLASNYLRKFSKNRDKSQITDSIDEPYEDSESGPSRIVLGSDERSPEDRLLMSEAIRSLDGTLRETWLLYHEMGFQIESKDPAEKTIANHFRVTGRTVRNRLREADERLRKFNEGL